MRRGKRHNPGVCRGLPALVALGVMGAAWAVPPEPVSAERIRALEPSVARLTTSSGNGTGFLVRADGVMVTAYHVVAGEAGAWAHFPGGKVSQAEGLLAVYPERDLAVLKLREQDLPPGLPLIPLHILSGPRAEAAIVALGYPGGGERKVAHGRLLASRGGPAKGGARSLNLYAPVRPGFSGGPALDAAGRAVGVVVSGFRGENLSFAAGLDLLTPLPAPGSPVESFDAYNLRLANIPEEQYSRGLRVLDFWRDHEREAPQVRAAIEWALLQFNAARRRRPALSGAHLNAAHCYAQLGKLAEGLKALELCLKHANDPLIARLTLADAYIEVGRLAEGAAMARAVLRDCPSFPPARRSLAAYFRKRKQWSLAEAELRAAVRDAPHDARSHFELGQLLAETGRRPAGVAALSKAEALDPEDAELQHELGQAYLAMKLPGQAAEAYREVVRARPKYTAAHFGLARACLALGDRDGARRAYATLERLKSVYAPRVARLLEQ